MESAVERCLSTGKPYVLTTEFFSKDRRPVAVEIHCGAAEWRDGRVVRLSGVRIDRSRDTEALRNLDAARRMLARTARIGRTGGWTLNPALGILGWTEEMYAIHRVSKDFELTLGSFANLYAEEQRASLLRSLEAFLISGDPVEYELELVTPRARRSWIRVIAELACEIGSRPARRRTSRRRGRNRSGGSVVRFESRLDGNQWPGRSFSAGQSRVVPLSWMDH